MKKTLLAIAIAFSSTVNAVNNFNSSQTIQYVSQDQLQFKASPADHFTGSAHFALYPRADESRDGWAIVNFDQGAVNNWHSHSKGQYLIITQGTGLVQEWEKPVQIVQKGDVVWIPAGVKHWHGAAPNYTMSHITIVPDVENNKTTWYKAPDLKNFEMPAIKADDSVKQSTPLTERQLAIVPIAALTTEGNITQLKSALEKGLNQGLTINDIREIFTHLQAYAGFPRALNGLMTFNKLLEERASQGINDPEGQSANPINPEANYANGVQTLVNMGSAAATAGTLFNSEGMDYALKANLFGYLFERGVLSYTDREIVVLSTIASLGNGVEAQLGSHLRNTNSLGIKSSDLQKIIDGVKAINSSNGERAQKVLDGLKLQ